MKSLRRVLISFLVVIPALAYAGPDAPSVVEGAATFSGDQSGGIAVTNGTNPSSAAVDTLNLTAVGAGVVVPNIVFTSQGNREVNINLGSATESVNVATTTPRHECRRRHIRGHLERDSGRHGQYRQPWEYPNRWR